MINIVEIQQPMQQGMTKPWLCRGDDGHQYVVKRLNASLQGCIYEWIAGNLGQKFGLNIPDVVLVYIDESLVEYDFDLQLSLGTGVAFASRYHPSLIEINYNELALTSPAKLRDLYVFDYWIKNDDRTLTEKGGNPNLFQDITSKNLVIFDHNLAFDPDFDLHVFKKTHVASFLLKGQTDLFSGVVERNDYESRLRETLAELNNIISSLPSEWLDALTDAAGELDRLRLVLDHYEHDEFWEALI